MRLLIAVEAGVTDIVVSDGHWNSGNVLIEELHPQACRMFRAAVNLAAV